MIFYREDIYNSDDVVAYFGNLPSEEMLATFKNLQWVHFGSVGIDKLSKNFIKNHSLTITNSAHTNSSAVTTYCLGELFKSCKKEYAFQEIFQITTYLETISIIFIPV